MTRLALVLLAVASCAVVVPSVAAAQQTAETVVSGTDGASVYKTYCAVCHGKEGKGDGPLSEHLRFQPPDLTTIAKRDGGKFEDDKVRRMIDGREPVKGHGGPDMPVWGDALKHTSEGYSEKAVKARIDALVAHLRGMQAR